MLHPCLLAKHLEPHSADTGASWKWFTTNTTLVYPVERQEPQQGQRNRQRWCALKNSQQNLVSSPKNEYWACCVRIEHVPRERGPNLTSIYLEGHGLNVASKHATSSWSSRFLQTRRHPPKPNQTKQARTPVCSRYLPPNVEVSPPPHQTVPNKHYGGHYCLAVGFKTQNESGVKEWKAAHRPCRSVIPPSLLTRYAVCLRSRL